MRQLYPFSKNLYFPQKRMRAEDFIRDQAFADNKLSFLNHWLFGQGIALGLRVQRVDSASLLVEPGFAVDGQGRYVVVDEVAVCRLRALDGFDRVQGENAVLWLHYGEEEQDPMLVAGGGERNTVARERFRFSLSDAACLGAPGAERAVFSQCVLFEDSELRVTQSIPKLFSGRGATSLRLIFECYNPEPVKLDVVYQPKLPGFTGLDGHGAPRLERHLELEKGETVLTLPVVPAAAGQTVCVQVEEQDFTLEKHSRRFGALKAVRQEFPVTLGDAAAQLASSLAEKTIEEVWDAPEEGVPIAYLRLLRMGEQSLLDDTAPLSGRYRTGLPYLEECVRRVSACYGVVPECDPPPAAPIPEPERLQARSEPAPRQMTTGIVVLNSGIHAEEGGVLSSEEIVHGLGPGSVFVEFGIENRYPVVNDTRNDTDLLLGDASLFTQASGSFNAGFDRGVRVHPEKGTFELAVRLKGSLRQPSLRLRWFAWRADSAPKPETAAGTLVRLEPDVIRVGPGESVRFTPVFSSGTPAVCDFFVEGRRSGSVTREGRYTAPEHAGLFMVHAQVQGRSEERASAFVIVGEKQDEPAGE